MKTVTLPQDQGELARLIEEVYAGTPVLLPHGNKIVKVERYVPAGSGTGLDPEQDSAELEAELLKGVRDLSRPIHARI